MWEDERFLPPFFGRTRVTLGVCVCGLGGDWITLSVGVVSEVAEDTSIETNRSFRSTLPNIWVTTRGFRTWRSLLAKVFFGVGYRLVQNTWVTLMTKLAKDSEPGTCGTSEVMNTGVREHLFKYNHQRSLLFVLSNWEWVDCLDNVLEGKKHVGKNPSVFALLDVYSRDCISTTTRRGRRTGRQFRTDVQIIWQSRGGGVKTRLCRGSN